MKILFQKRDYLYKFANNKVNAICKYELINACMFRFNLPKKLMTGVYKLSQNTTSAALSGKLINDLKILYLIASRFKSIDLFYFLSCIFLRLKETMSV